MITGDNLYADWKICLSLLFLWQIGAGCSFRGTSLMFCCHSIFALELSFGMSLAYVTIFAILFSGGGGEW